MPGRRGRPARSCRPTDSRTRYVDRRGGHRITDSVGEAHRFRGKLERVVSKVVIPRPIVRSTLEEPTIERQGELFKWAVERQRGLADVLQKQVTKVHLRIGRDDDRAGEGVIGQVAGRVLASVVVRVLR
jgi:hypothetical protein